MSDGNKIIIVNATGTTSGGGLNVLGQFLENLALYDTVNEYYVFVRTEALNKYDGRNIHIVSGVYRRKWIGRIWWDNIGIGQWLKRHQLTPCLILSLQNTGIRLGRKVRQIIYYHQSLPLYEYKWSFWKKEERLLWFYKNLYPWFVKRHFYGNDVLVVQSNWMKEKAHERFKIRKEQIILMRSDSELRDTGELDVNLDRYTFFYPAIALKYKNHAVIFEALDIIRRKNKAVYDRIHMTFTCSRDDFRGHQDREFERVHLTGYLQYDEMLSQYKEHGTLLFPSYLESFALPLTEAAHFGMAILAADLPYARETIGEYEGARFLEYNNAGVWADAIIKIVGSNGKRFAQKDTQESESWKMFFDLIKNQIQ